MPPPQPRLRPKPQTPLKCRGQASGPCRDSIAPSPMPFHTLGEAELLGIADPRFPIPKPHALNTQTEAELLDRAGGSVRDLKLSLEDIEAKRGSAKGDLAAAMRLMSLHLK